MAECERCRGTGFESVAAAGSNGAAVESVRPCACRRVDAQPTEALLIERLRIPPRYQHCLLSEFKPGGETLKTAALMKVMKYCKDYPSRGEKSSNDRGLGLLFTGGNGTGKTHLAVSALRELATEHGVAGQFATPTTPRRRSQSTKCSSRSSTWRCCCSTISAPGASPTG
jgi:hypothetical protein